ncbi:hypothetical protein COY93_01290 [Candidatus Uhrbacteria bacterium CG_4_10_14_0_8_um_filter_58_22]|uniref:Baseplate protein J-like domain-containing protein n=1 Tax=Candidatus Uhrbacteria bacterium CG_4_10_14_0_8_um_filter_58_22 TaxID=1975029 RepID=A0A2M7QBK5_9BACT|nr:MAG: hypothetical protein AUJ19_03890 [Parcubacteria group bacterium CG1_02_58_44]PIY63145.1 MAG: hypothetical protein COY93_01290 [Candidatus Uhrbacteria bacterium CG_4_10_14_0_8_um_filter_58_22]
MIQVSEPKQNCSARHWRTNRLIAFVFVVVTAAIAVFSLLIVFSRATVVVLSKQRDIESELIVDIASSPTGDEVPGSVYKISRSATESFPVSSSVTVETRAEGRVRIVSELSRAQTLVASTRLVTPDGVQFRLKDTVVVPAFGSVEGVAVSDESGPSGDVGETTFTIPGLNEGTRQFFSVETVGSLMGGRKETYMVTAAELSKAEDEMVGRLSSELTSALRGQARDDGSRPDGELFSFDVTKRLADTEIGEETESFNLSVTVEGKGVFFDRSAFDGSVNRMLTARLLFGRELATVNVDTSRTEIEKIDLIGRRANVRVTVQGASILSAEAAGLDPEKLVGVTSTAAVQYLEGLDGVSSASVSLCPFWLRRLPNVAEHIMIEVR